MSGEPHHMPMLTNTNIARRGDPDTSHAGDRHITDSGKRAEQQSQVVPWVRQYPGLTSRELAAKAAENLAPHMNHEVFHKRLPELAADHDRDGNVKVPLVKRGHKRRCSITNCKAVTWYEIGAEIPPLQMEIEA